MAERERAVARLEAGYGVFLQISLHVFLRAYGHNWLRCIRHNLADVTVAH